MSEGQESGYPNNIQSLDCKYKLNICQLIVMVVLVELLLIDVHRHAIAHLVCTKTSVKKHYYNLLVEIWFYAAVKSGISFFTIRFLLSNPLVVEDNSTST